MARFNQHDRFEGAAVSGHSGMFADPTTRTVRFIGVFGLVFALFQLLLGARPASAAVNQPLACPAVGGLPLYTPASCDSFKQDRDGGVTETESRYLTSHGANTVRQFFERAFGPAGWTVVGTKHDLEDAEYKYILRQGQRFAQVAVEARDLDDGGGTRIEMDETSPNQSLSCAPIGGLPLYTPASCDSVKQDRDGGVTAIESRYLTSHGANTVRQFFERAFGPAGWTVVGTKHDLEDAEYKYVLRQGFRTLELKVEEKWSRAGVSTKISLAEQG